MNCKLCNMDLNLGAFVEGDAFTLSCGHTFHNKCIQRRVDSGYPYCTVCKGLIVVRDTDNVRNVCEILKQYRKSVLETRGIIE